MTPQNTPKDTHPDLFRQELMNLIDRRHELVKLSDLIDWEGLAQEVGALYVEGTGRPGIRTRLMVG